MATSNQGSPMAAVGSYDSILPFKAIGLDVVEITDENRDSIGEIMNRFAIKGYAALFVEEALFSKYQQAVDEVNESTDMCIIPVPDQSGSMGVGLSSIRRNVE
ncbi:MAG: V-type ATP synthase subunit F, partial [Synergistaceae bacterium]|nr:V-type ATP synthase subunit F [Synergistaceae bacterium]